MDQNSTGLMYLEIRIPRISDAKIKEGAFIGPKIRELTQDINSEDQLSEAKKQHGNHLKMSLPIFWETIRQKTITTWGLIL